MNQWKGQYLEQEKMYYLTVHGDDGIEGEHFFDTLCGFRKFIKGNNLNVNIEK